MIGLRRWSPVEPHRPMLLSMCITALGKEVHSEVPKLRDETKSLRAREGQQQRLVEGACSE